MWYGQSDFGAAVALACGRGYVDPGDNLTPGLTRFLSLQADTFSCAELPEVLPPRPLRITARLYPYLLSATAGVWAVRGVSWPALWPLFGLLYGATVAVCYGLFRLGMGRTLATAASVALMVSPVHLGNLPGLRDYAKAPFILGSILIAALLVRRLDETRSRVGLSVLLGVILGIGFGFRNDILIVVPLIIVAVLAWHAPRNVRAIRTRLAALAVAAVTFAVVASPILAGYLRGSNSGHVALLGLMTPFDEPLGVVPSVYEWGRVYSDGFIGTTINSYSYRAHDRPVDYLSREYDRTAAEYLVRVARNWPADIITRAYASVLRVVDMPFTPGTHAHAVPDGLTGPAVTRFFGWYNAVVSLMKGKGGVVVAVALLVISGTSVWWAVLLLADLLYLAGYPAIQFQPRHFFHLEFIAWWALGVCIEAAVAIIVAAIRARRGENAWPSISPAARRAAVFAVIALVMLVVPFATARAYQERHVRELLTRYAAAPRDPLSIDVVASGNRLLLQAPALWDGRDPRQPVGTEYLAAHFAPAACPAARLPVTIRYWVAEGQQDYSFDTVVMFLHRSTFDLYFPVYDVPGKSRFSGVEVARGFERCVERISRLRDLRSLPILVNLRLTPGWDEGPLYQRLADWESADRAAGPTLLALPPELPLPLRTLEAPPAAPPILWKTPMVQNSSPPEWRITGTPESPIWPLVEFAAERRTPEDQFVIEGEVVRGGITVGLVRDHQWTADGNVTIAKRGRFVAVLTPRESGDYGALWENGLSASWFLRYAPAWLVRLVARVHDFNVVRIDRAGWVRGDACCER